LLPHALANATIADLKPSSAPDTTAIKDIPRKYDRIVVSRPLQNLSL
jgi:hypothetical protein